MSHKVFRFVASLTIALAISFAGFTPALALPPINDNFADATAINTLPFTESPDPIGATVEAGEPASTCAYYSPTLSIWYAFTPSSNGLIIVNDTSQFFTPIIAVYTGDSLAGLTEVGCQTYFNPLSFNASAGVTYYFQISNLYPWEPGGSMQFQVEVAPPPTVGFYYFPYDPTVFDTIQFSDQSYDPAFMGFQSYAWDFGDGATSTDVNPTHRYAADGDYTVQHTVTTTDGRTASASQVVNVKTHDVAIIRLSAPLSATSGQTRTITVQVSNKRYGEYVQVDLYKSVPGGFQLVGSYTQYVPVRPANRTTTFTFNYTFTKNDASLGKVTFKAVASIRDARDALPADNELTSAPPTRVPR